MDEETIKATAYKMKKKQKTRRIEISTESSNSSFRRVV